MSQSAQQADHYLALSLGHLPEAGSGQQGSQGQSGIR